MKGFLPSFLLKILITSLNYDCLIDKGPVHPYPNAFENASTRSVCESFSPVHTTTRKRYPLLSMRHATMYVNDVFWCMTSSYSKPPFLSVHTKRKNRRFQKSLLWRAFVKR